MVAGKTMRMAGGEERTVTGVYKDFPKNCNFENAVYMSLDEEQRECRREEKKKKKNTERCIDGVWCKFE